MEIHPGEIGPNARLNVGCGKRRIPGYIGIDIEKTEAADIVAPAHAIPLPDQCAQEVMAIHVIEHFFSWETPAVLKEWHRLLIPGGLLVLELPDAFKCARNLVKGVQARPGKPADQMHMWGLYGDDTLRNPYMMHKTGWWFDRLAPVVRAVGFRDVIEKVTQYHPAGRGIRDFRLEGVKA